MYQNIDGQLYIITNDYKNPEKTVKRKGFPRQLAVLPAEVSK